MQHSRQANLTACVSAVAAHDRTSRRRLLNPSLGPRSGDPEVLNKVVPNCSIGAPAKQPKEARKTFRIGIHDSWPRVDAVSNLVAVLKRLGQPFSCSRRIDALPKP